MHCSGLFFGVLTIPWAYQHMLPAHAVLINDDDESLVVTRGYSYSYAAAWPSRGQVSLPNVYCAPATPLAA